MRRTSSRGGSIRYTPVSVSSCRWQVETGRRRDGVAIYHPINRGFQNGPPCRLHGQGWQFERNAALSSGVRRRRNPPRRAHDFRRKYHRPFGVVSKCALRDKKEGGPRFPGDLPAVFNCALPAFAADILPDCQALPPVLPAALFPVQRPPVLSL